MPSFFPQTTIYACQTGIDDYNKVYFDTNAGAASYCLGRSVQSWSSYSYQRVDERQYCAVHANYNDLLGADTLVWQNADFGSFYYIANITGLEWKNPNTVWIWFKLDAFMTFCGDIDWNSSYCLVEREHVEGDWNGSIPQFFSSGAPEGFALEPTAKVSQVDRYRTPNRIVITSPYDSNGDENIEGTIQNNVYTGLNSYTFSTASAANNYLQAIADNDDADIGNVVSAITIPQTYLDGATEIFSGPTTPWDIYSGAIANAKCFCSEFCMLQITSLVGQTKTYSPELFLYPNNIQFQEEDTFAAGIGGVHVTPLNYGGNYAVDSYDNAFVISEFPSGVMTGDAYAQWLALNGYNTISGTIFNTLSSLFTGNAVATNQLNNNNMAGATATGINTITNIASNLNSTRQQFASAKMYGTATMGSANANPNVAAGLGRFGYSVSWLMLDSRILFALDDYFSRYGYRVNRLKIPNRNTRPHWNYVKCGEAHVHGSMPYSYRVEIETMLNNGVTFWNSGTTIGDFSDKMGNRG